MALIKEPFASSCSYSKEYTSTFFTTVTPLGGAKSNSEMHTVSQFASAGLHPDDKVHTVRAMRASFRLSSVVAEQTACTAAIATRLRRRAQIFHELATTKSHVPLSLACAMLLMVQ